MAIKSYDFIFGRKLSDYHTQSLYKDRVLSEEFQTDAGLLTLIRDGVLKMQKQVKLDLEDNVADCLTHLLGTIDQLLKGGTADPELDMKFREYLVLLQYFGYSLFLFERQDLNTDIVQPDAIEAYLYDVNDDLISDVGVIAKAWAVTFENPSQVSLPDVVMSFVGRVINFSSFTSDALKLRKEIETYGTLADTNSGHMFNVEPLLKFTENYGFRYHIVL